MWLISELNWDKFSSISEREVIRAGSSVTSGSCNGSFTLQEKLLVTRSKVLFALLQILFYCCIVWGIEFPHVKIHFICKISFCSNGIWRHNLKKFLDYTVCMGSTWLFWKYWILITFQYQIDRLVHALWDKAHGVKFFWTSLLNLSLLGFSLSLTCPTSKFGFFLFHISSFSIKIN